MEETPVYDKILVKDNQYHNTLDFLREEIKRLRDNNVNLKLQVIEEKEKLNKILEIINK